MTPDPSQPVPPPPVVPPATVAPPPPVYGAPAMYGVPPYGQPVAPRPKPPAFRFRNVFGGLFVVGLIVRVLGAAVGPALTASEPTNIVANGRSLSNGEAREGREEMERMMGGTQDDIDKVDTAYEPKTEMGRAFKTIILRQRTVIAEFKRFQGDRGVADLLTNARLGNTPGRAKSREELAAWRKAAATYFSESEAALLAARALDGNGSGTSSFGNPYTKLRESYEREFEIAEKTIAFADKAKPHVENGVLALSSDAEVKRYNELEAAFNRTASEFSTTAP